MNESKTFWRVFEIIQQVKTTIDKNDLENKFNEKETLHA